MNSRDTTLRITFVLNCFVRAPSGGFRVVYEYANRLAALGHQVTVVHEQWREGWHRPTKHLYEIARDRWHTRSPNGLADWLSWMSVRPEVRMTMVRRLTAAGLPDGDVVVATYWTTARLLADLSSRHGKPVHLVQLYEIWGVSNPKDVDDVLLLNVPKIVVSHHLAKTLQSLGVPAPDITVVPNGLDHSVYREPSRKQPRSATVSVLLSNSAQKDSPTAIEAVRLAKQRMPGLRITAFGTTRRPRELPRWAEYFRGASGAKLAEIYQRSAVYICSSVSEGWGFPVAEAMACGTAVVSTLNGGVEDFCVHDRNSLLVPVGDVNGIADSTVSLIQNESLRTRLVNAGLDTTAGMDWDISTRLFLAAIRSVLNASG